MDDALSWKSVVFTLIVSCTASTVKKPEVSDFVWFDSSTTWTQESYTGGHMKTILTNSRQDLSGMAWFSDDSWLDHSDMNKQTKLQTTLVPKLLKKQKPTHAPKYHQYSIWSSLAPRVQSRSRNLRLSLV